MRMVNAVIGCILLFLATLHFFVPNHTGFIALYGSGAVLAFITLRTTLNTNTARLFAVATTAVMFFYFAGFFKMAPHFTEYWYRSGTALEGVGLLLSAFAMIPVLSSYSCMLKADCQEAMQQRARRRARRPAFFSVPDNIEENSA